MKKRLFIIIAAVLWIALPQASQATAQTPDILIVGKDTLPLFCNPLESYFDEEHPRPNDMNGIFSTACWRGYKAYFELRSDSLFLTGIFLGNNGDSSIFYPLSKLFGDKATPSGVFAYWVNETLLCVGGKELLYIHMGYSSLYEFDIEYTVRKGIVKNKHVWDNSKTFLPYSAEHDGSGNIFNYSLFTTFLESQIDYSKLDAEDLDEYVTLIIKKVDNEGHIKKYDIKGASPNQKRAIRKALKKVPRFNVIYSRGKPMSDIKYNLNLAIYANEGERAKRNPANGPDIGEWNKKKISENNDRLWHLRHLAEEYQSTYTSWKEYIADTSADEKRYKDYYSKLFGDSLFYQHHFFITLGDSALKYYYQYWDETDDHESLYPEIVQLEQELGRPHNPKIIKEENPEFVCFVKPDELDPSNFADSDAVDLRCRQVSYHLRGFGEGDLHEPLPKGIIEEWRFLLLRGHFRDSTSPMLVKIMYDGKDARISWRVAKEDRYKTYPDLDHFRHGIRSEGERLLTADEWQQLLKLADEAGIDKRSIDNDYFSSPPAIYHVEHRTATAYHAVNDYNHPYYHDYYDKDISLHFWPYRAFCKYLINLADPSLPFDSDDIR